MENLYNFSDAKIELLKDANVKLCINNLKDRGLIFIYCPPKVGSTSLVSYIRLFASNLFSVIHLHDELMLKVLTNIKDVSINEIINYNAQIGRKVYVIDVYRLPIERKISTFFEEISTLHFNNSEDAINNYNINRVVKRFNMIFPHIANGDHFMDKYDIKDELPVKFDLKQKYILIDKNGIIYLKLRLQDSSEWGKILSEILKTKIIIKNDYETKDKILRDLFKKFNEEYKIPKSLLKEINECKYLKYYCTEIEINAYLNKWLKRSEKEVISSWSMDEYKKYIEISIENQISNKIQSEHYIDEGCICESCKKKRELVKTGEILEVRHVAVEPIKVLKRKPISVLKFI